MWTRLAAKELIAGYKALKAAALLPVERPRSNRRFELQSELCRADMLGEAQACFDRARAFRRRAA
jgi:hypothetical protein